MSFHCLKCLCVQSCYCLHGTQEQKVSVDVYHISSAVCRPLSDGIHGSAVLFHFKHLGALHQCVQRKHSQIFRLIPNIKNTFPFRSIPQHWFYYERPDMRGWEQVQWEVEREKRKSYHRDHCAWGKDGNLHPKKVDSSLSQTVQHELCHL